MRSILSWIGGALLACALAAGAQAQVPASSLPQNLVDQPLPTTASDPSNMTMRAAVLLMRHGVRPPTSTPKFQPYAAAPFPSNGPTGWNAPDAYLTPYGATLIQALGSIERGIYAAKGIVSKTGCPAANELFVWADNADERTQATGAALLAGLYNGCAFSHYYSSSTTADPLFSSPFTLPDTTAATNAVLARMGGSIGTAQAYVASLLSKMNTVLGCCSATLCAQNGLSAGCSFPQLPAAITASGGSLSFTGPLATGSSIAQVFELEYENGFTGSNLGFGVLSESDVQQLEQLYTTKYNLFDRTPILAQQNGSTVAQQMLDAVLSAVPGQTAPAGGPPKAKLTVYVGHDGTLAALGGMLNLHWSLPTFPPDDMPGGLTVGFEVFSDSSGAYFVRPVALSLTLDAMHSGVPAANFRAPVYEALQLPGAAWTACGCARWPSSRP